MRVHHVNLTALIGYFHEADQMGLIYEFMANGNMADHLAGKYEHTLSWTQRLQIALDAAQGMNQSFDLLSSRLLVSPKVLIFNEKSMKGLSIFTVDAHLR